MGLDQAGGSLCRFNGRSIKPQEVVAPLTRLPSEPARTVPAGTVRRHDPPSPPSRAPLRSDGRVERPAEEKRPVRIPAPGQVVQAGAGHVAAPAPAAGRPGTGTEPLIDTRDDPRGPCPAAGWSRSAPRAGG